MIHRKFRNLFPALLGLFLSGYMSVAGAGTGILLKTTDGSVIHGRTFDATSSMSSGVVVVPRDQEFTGTTPDYKTGLTWTNTFAFTGVSFLGMPHVLDGVNEQGLGVGVFLFPGYADYVHERPKKLSKALAPWEVSSWILSNFTSISEVKSAIGGVIVVPVPLDEFGGIPYLHWIVHDANGFSVVLEAENGHLIAHADPLGVITNGPDFEWQITNLRNFLNSSPVTVPATEVGEIRFGSSPAQAALAHLPSDMTSPSRFVRAVWATQNTMTAVTPEDGVSTAFHILNAFDIPVPLATDQYGDPIPAVHTVWTTAIDLKNARLYFHTYDNRRVRMVDLMSQDLEAETIQMVSMAGGEDIQSLSNGGPEQQVGSPRGIGSGSSAAQFPVEIIGDQEDTIARQIREAAEKEIDPELRKSLIEEYRRYQEKQSQ